MKNIIHFIVAFLIFASIQSAEAVVGGNGRSAGHENIGFVPGQIIVKFHTEGEHALLKSPEFLLKQARTTKPFKQATVDQSDSLDKLMQKHNVIKAQRLAFDGLSQDAVQAAYQERQLIRMNRLRYWQRSQRVSQDYEFPELSSIYILNVPQDADVMKVVKDFVKDPHVEYAELDYYLTVQEVKAVAYYPNDEKFAKQESLQVIQAPAAWQQSTGEGTIVAVVDTGVDVNHEDLFGNIWINEDDPPGDIPDGCNRALNPEIALADDDCNHRTDDTLGWNFFNDNNLLYDDHGHGTHVAGIIGAIGDNGKGIAGVAPNTKIMVVKVGNASGLIGISFAVKGILYAALEGADIINNSWGGPGPANITLQNAVKTAYGLGAAVVFAAGNSNEDMSQWSPANMKETVAVSAFSDKDKKAGFSNFGSLIDVAAPGVGILSLKPGDKYVSLSGTSMAAPHVSGALALILSNKPTFYVKDLVHDLRASADDVGSEGFDIESGYGRINVLRALNVDRNVVSKIEFPENFTVVNPDDKILNINGTSSGEYFNIFVGRESNDIQWIKLTNDETAVVENGLLATWDVSHLEPGKYLIRLSTVSNGHNFDDVVTAQVPTRVVTGQVVDENTLAPIAGAVVTLSGKRLDNNFKSSTTVISDENGMFVIRGVPSLYRVVINTKPQKGAQKFIFDRLVNVDLSQSVEIKGALRKDGSLAVLGTLSIKGRVLSYGKGIADVKVRLIPKSKTAGTEKLTAFTDINGEYVFENLVPGVYLIQVTPKGDYVQPRLRVVLDDADLMNANFIRVF